MSSSAIGCVGVRHPARRDHHRQPLDEPEDRLEGGAALADDHRRAQRRHRHPVRGEVLAGLATAAQVRRRVGIVPSEPAEVDDLPHARARRLARDVLGRLPVLPLEVARAERVDEVVGDIGPLERLLRRLRRTRRRPRPSERRPRLRAGRARPRRPRARRRAAAGAPGRPRPSRRRPSTFMPRAPARAARSSAGSRRRGTGSGPSRRGRPSTRARRPRREPRQVLLDGHAQLVLVAHGVAGRASPSRRPQREQTALDRVPAGDRAVARQRARAGRR